jgi:hypothetical protein
MRRIMELAIGVPTRPGLEASDPSGCPARGDLSRGATAGLAKPDKVSPFGNVNASGVITGASSAAQGAGCE